MLGLCLASLTRCPLFQKVITTQPRSYAKVYKALRAIPSVDIGDGPCRYVLVEVRGRAHKKGSVKKIVRSYSDCLSHTEVFDRVVSIYDMLKVDLKCLGGGILRHSPYEKRIELYGKSRRYGRANHKEAARILKRKLRKYKIKVWS